MKNKEVGYMNKYGEIPVKDLSISDCGKFLKINEAKEWLVKAWLEKHELLKTHRVGHDILIDISEYNLADIFQHGVDYMYIDGFSPNQNKQLHLGHLANFVLARAMSGLMEDTTPLYIKNNVPGIEGKYVQEIKEFMSKNDYHPHTFDPSFYAKEYASVSWFKKIVRRIKKYEPEIKLVTISEDEDAKYAGTNVYL